MIQMQPQTRKLNKKTARIYLKRAKRRRKGLSPRLVWVLRWFTSDGVERFETIGECKDMPRRQAQAIQRQRQGEMDGGAFPRDRPRKLSLGDFRAYLIDAIEGDVKPATLDSYDLALRQLEALLGGDFATADVTVEHVLQLRKFMVERESSPSSMRTMLATLKAAFNRAKAWGLVGENPFGQQPLPRQRPRAKRIFSLLEIDAMIAAAPNNWWKTLILLAATSGLRKQELFHLTWNDIDFDHAIVCVTPKREGTFDVSGEEYPILEWSPKNHQARSVPIPKRTLESLEGLKDEPDGSKYVFLDLTRLRLIRGRQRSGGLRRRFDVTNNLIRDFHRIQKRAAKAVGRSDWAIGSFHDLRKTFGTLAAHAVPMHVLRQLLGHRDITTTANYYLAADLETAAPLRSIFSLPVQPRLLPA
jgi:integrase